MIFQFGEYKIDVDVEKTRQFYDRAKTVSEGCQCDGCLNFERAVDKLPQNIRDFFSALGVDIKKSANVMSIAPKTKTRCTTAAFATSAELYSAAKARGNRQATLQPVGTKKQHIRSRRILAFRSATVSTCRSRIFLFQLFSSTSMRISRGCSKRKTAILTNNETKKGANTTHFGNMSKTAVNSR